MMITCHVLTGAALGRVLRRPWLACPAALASHIALDAIRHADTFQFLSPELQAEGMGRCVLALIDAGLGATLLLWATHGARDRWLLLACAALALLTDLLHLPRIGPWLEHWHVTAGWARAHEYLQSHSGTRHLLAGLATQAATALGALVVLRRVPPPPQPGSAPPGGESPC